jgi:hypothetical protein
VIVFFAVAWYLSPDYSSFHHFSMGLCPDAALGKEHLMSTTTTYSEMWLAVFLQPVVVESSDNDSDYERDDDFLFRSSVKVASSIIFDNSCYLFNCGRYRPNI